MIPLSRRVFVLIACETGLIIAAVWLAAYVRFGGLDWTVMAEQNGMPKAFLIAAVCQLCLYYSDLYDFRKIGRSQRASGTHHPDARRGVVRPRGYLLLVPRIDDRTRRVFSVRRFRHRSRLGMASGVRVVVETRRAEAAAAARRHRGRDDQARARTHGSQSGARRRHCRLHRCRSDGSQAAEGRCSA